MTEIVKKSINLNDHHSDIKIIIFIKSCFLLSEFEFSEVVKISVVILHRCLFDNIYVRLGFFE